jgi:HNH endonuclease
LDRHVATHYAGSPLSGERAARIEGRGSANNRWDPGGLDPRHVWMEPASNETQTTYIIVILPQGLGWSDGTRDEPSPPGAIWLSAGISIIASIAPTYRVMDERFREIADFPGYRVSRDGEVQSRWGRGRRDWRKGTWRPLKPIRRDGGYYAVNLHRDGKKTARHIHRLVLDAFVGPRPPGMVCRHLDGDPSNNFVENLAWGSYAENEADKLRHGTRARGSRARSKFYEDQVLEIRQRWSEGVSVRELAATYGVRRQTVESIVSGKTWRHLLSHRSGIDAAHEGQQGSEGRLGTAHSAQTRSQHSSQSPTQQPQAGTPQVWQV